MHNPERFQSLDLLPQTAAPLRSKVYSCKAFAINSGLLLHFTTEVHRLYVNNAKTATESVSQLQTIVDAHRIGTANIMHPKNMTVTASFKDLSDLLSQRGACAHLQLGAGGDHVLVALGHHDGLEIARDKLQAHTLQLLRMVLLCQGQRRCHSLHLYIADRH